MASAQKLQWEDRSFVFSTVNNIKGSRQAFWRMPSLGRKIKYNMYRMLRVRR